MKMLATVTLAAATLADLARVRAHTWVHTKKGDDL
jgi:hypothetical protein